VSTGASEPGRVPGPKVFITYRREETSAQAGRLYDAMVGRFGENNVFMDVDMAPGVDFVERIAEAVAACHVLIVVMGPHWATVEDERGRRRLADPEDFVRLEVETALRRPDVTPIPVLVAGGRMPSREDLPEEVRAITRRNALELSDMRWRQDVGRLISTLDELLANLAVAPPITPEGNLAVAPPVTPAGHGRERVAGDGAGEAAMQPAPAPNGAPAPPGEAEAPAPPAPGPSRRPARSRRRWWALAGLAVAAVIGIAVALLAGGGSGGGGTTSGGGTPVSDEVHGIQLVPFTDASAFTLKAPQWRTPHTPEDPIGKGAHLTALVSPNEDMTVQVVQQPEEPPLQKVAGKANKARVEEGATSISYNSTSIAGRDAYLLQFTHNEKKPDQPYLPAMGETYDSTYFFNDFGFIWRVHAAVKTTVADGKDIARGLATKMAETFEPKG
jgi:hypothetical protein